MSSFLKSESYIFCFVNVLLHQLTLHKVFQKCSLMLSIFCMQQCTSRPSPSCPEFPFAAQPSPLEILAGSGWQGVGCRPWIPESTRGRSKWQGRGHVCFLVIFKYAINSEYVSIFSLYLDTNCTFLPKTDLPCKQKEKVKASYFKYDLGVFFPSYLFILNSQLLADNWSKQ